MNVKFDEYQFTEVQAILFMLYPQSATPFTTIFIYLLFLDQSCFLSFTLVASPAYGAALYADI